MESGNVDMKWYVLQAYSGYENKVKQTLEDTIKREGLEDSFGEILVPTEEVLEIKEGQKKRTERKYFPGYVLIKSEMDNNIYHMIKNIQKVTGFLGTTGNPTPVSEKRKLSLGTKWIIKHARGRKGKHMKTKLADELIKSHLQNWEFDRVAQIDRLLLRMGICEIFFIEEIPPKVSISEMVEISKVYSTDESPGFINGILDAVYKDYQKQEKN